MAALLLVVPQKVRPNQAANDPIQIDEQLLTDFSQGQSPTRIVIPKLNIDLPVVEARVVRGYWELSENSASFGLGSAYPGQKGNSVIFAHAREGLFLPLRQIEENTPIYVLTKDKWYAYKVTETKLVNPDEVAVIDTTENEQLTLFTCSGFLDSKRLIVTATPQ